MRQNETKYRSTLVDVLDGGINKESLERLNSDLEPNIRKIARVEKAINFVRKLFEKSNQLVENVMQYKQD